MDIKLLESLNAKLIPVSKKKPMETSIEVIKCLASMEVLSIIIIGTPDMYKFIYNLTRLRHNTLPNDFKHITKEKRKYMTLNLIEHESLLIIRVK